MSEPIVSGQVTGNNSETFTPSPQENKLQGRHRILITKDVGDGTGSFDLEISPDDGTTWQSLQSITVGTPTTFEYFPGLEYRLTSSGGTSPDVKWWIF